MSLLRRVITAFSSAFAECESPPVRKPEIKNHDAEVYKEQMNELRWRRDQDRHYITIFLTALGFSIAAYYAVLSKGSMTVALAGTVMIIPFFPLFIGIFCSVKIVLDHQQYRKAALPITRILSRWEMISKQPAPPEKSLLCKILCPDEANTGIGVAEEKVNFPNTALLLGSGDGYKASVRLIIYTALVFLLINFGWLTDRLFDAAESNEREVKIIITKNNFESLVTAKKTK